MKYLSHQNHRKGFSNSLRPRIILGLVVLFLLSSCAAFRKPAKDENNSQDDKKSNRKNKEPKVMCYYF